MIICNLCVCYLLCNYSLWE